MRGFATAYVKSMRLYYAFITGIAGWIGVAYYDFIVKSSFRTVEVFLSIEKKIVILMMLFLSWGINQIINDYLGLREDRINAPQRPMVTGELNAKKALILSGVLQMGTFLVTLFYLQPIAIIPAALGILLNILYEYAKGFGFIGNIVFGLMISMCTIFGFLASGPTAQPYFTLSRISVLILVAVMNGIMTFYTYFKDYKGDKEAGKNTVIVKFGIQKSRYIGVVLSFVPAVLFILLYLNNYIEAKLQPAFFILAILAFILQLWTGALYYKKPEGTDTYYSLSVNFRACTCGQAVLIALFHPKLAAVLFFISYFFVKLLFHLHSNPQS